MKRRGQLAFLLPLSLLFLINAIHASIFYTSKEVDDTTTSDLTINFTTESPLYNDNFLKSETVKKAFENAPVKDTKLNPEASTEKSLPSTTKKYRGKSLDEIKEKVKAGDAKGGFRKVMELFETSEVEKNLEDAFKSSAKRPEVTTDRILRIPSRMFYPFGNINEHRRQIIEKSRKLNLNERIEKTGRKIPLHKTSYDEHQVTEKARTLTLSQIRERIARIPMQINPVLEKLPQAEKDAMSTDHLFGDMSDDINDDDDDDEYDDEDDEDEDEDDDDYDLDDSESVMFDCPDYCRCTGQFGPGLTARCSKLEKDQIFGSRVNHLLIENAGEIALGPHALKSHNLIHLETLTIVDTRISLIDRTAFSGVPSLFSVKLNRCGVIDMHPDTFMNNSQLNLLTISGHPYWRDWTVHKKYLFNSPSIIEFDFSWNSFPHLPDTAFEKMPNLAYLNLKQNRLNSVNKSMFESLEDLVKLDLSANLLSDESLYIFDGLPIQSLKLAENSFTSLQNLKSNEITSLDISYNHITEIEKDDLIGLRTLQELILSENKLKNISEEAFLGLADLHHLDLSRNNLEEINEHHFVNNAELQVLVLNDNPKLGSLPVFKVVGYEYNAFNIFRFECANCGLKTLDKNVFSAMTALTELNLARNKFQRIPSGIFEPLSALRKLDLSDNYIVAIYPSTFKGAVTLTKLNLAGNLMETLYISAFTTQTPELARLDVSRCNLFKLWSEAQSHLKSLRFLSVRSNHLRQIDVEELKATPKLTGLDASHNNLICNEAFNNTIHYLINRGIAPLETSPYLNLKDDESHHMMISYTNWGSFAQDVCSDEGPPPRSRPIQPPRFLPEYNDAVASVRSKEDLVETEESDIDFMNKMGESGDTDWDVMNDDDSDSGLTWDNVSSFWPILTIAIIGLAVILIIVQLIRCVSKRRGRGPVIRPPLMLRQGLVDNKNCGLVYKPLHEEIPTPQMPKRGSFYSSSTFHYDKIVPEKV